MATNLSTNPHPFGQIPCLVDDGDVVVFESGAILLYLLNKATTDHSAKEHAAVVSWISWANASLDPICFLETPDGKVYDTGLKKPNRRIDRLNQLLEGQRFLLGETFSLADVAVASYLLYVLLFFPTVELAPRWPHVARYMQEAAARPAYGKAFGVVLQNKLVASLRAKANARFVE
jgi:glutathione S-transferase